MIILEGMESAAIQVTGVSASASPVTLTAALEGVEVTAQVRVLDGSELPLIDSLSPAAMSLGMNETGTLTATLNIPARAGGETLGVLATPGTHITVPATVAVPQGEFGVDIPITSLSSSGSETITVSLEGSEQEATVEVVDFPVTGLLLAQVYYDHTSTDDGYEWVQLYNGSGDPIDLSGYSLGYAGSDFTYGTYQLAGTIPPFSCFVAGGPNVDEGNGNPIYDQTLDFSPDLQNSGSTADGVALFNVPASEITASTVPIDALIYGGSNDNNLLDETGSPGAVDAGDCDADISLLRGPGAWVCQDPPTPLNCPAF